MEEAPLVGEGKGAGEETGPPPPLPATATLPNPAFWGRRRLQQGDGHSSWKVGDRVAQHTGAQRVGKET